MLKVPGELQYGAHLVNLEVHIVYVEHLDVRNLCHSRAFAIVCPFYASRLLLSCAGDCGCCRYVATSEAASSLSPITVEHGVRACTPIATACAETSRNPVCHGHAPKPAEDIRSALADRW